MSALAKRALGWTEQGLVPDGTPLDGTVRRLRALDAEEPEFMGPAVWEYAWQQIIHSIHYEI